MDVTDNWQDSFDGGSALSQGRYLHRTTRTEKYRGQTFMPKMGFEPTIPVFERGKTFHASHCAATMIGPEDLAEPIMKLRSESR
jgi:hypothetical protein